MRRESCDVVCVFGPEIQARKMPLTTLCFAILFALSTTALGQTLPADCTSALNRFSEDLSCFGSQAALDAYRNAYSSVGGFSDPLAALSNTSVQQATRIFYNNFCTSQSCVQSFANTFQVCLQAFQQQVCMSTTGHAHKLNVLHYIVCLIVGASLSEPLMI